MHSTEELEKARLETALAKAKAARWELIYKKMERENAVEDAENSLLEQDMRLEEIEERMASAGKLSLKDQMKFDLEKSQCGTNKLRIMLITEDKKEEVIRISDHIKLQEDLINEHSDALDKI